MRLRTRSKNLFFPSGLFLMCSIYSVVCLALPLWSLMPKCLAAVGRWSPRRRSARWCSQGRSGRRGPLPPRPGGLGDVAEPPRHHACGLEPCCWRGSAFRGKPLAFGGWQGVLAPLRLRLSCLGGKRLPRGDRCLGGREGALLGRRAELTGLFLLKALPVTNSSDVCVWFSLLKQFVGYRYFSQTHPSKQPRVSAPLCPPCRWRCLPKMFLFQLPLAVPLGANSA